MQQQRFIEIQLLISISGFGGFGGFGDGEEVNTK